MSDEGESVFAGLPVGEAQVIEADPPWNFKVRSAKGHGRSPERHYRTMKLADIMALPVRSLAAKNCHLFLWTTGPHLPQALRVMEAWGFKYSGLGFTWIKLLRSEEGALMFDRRSFHMGPGYTTRKNAELCLLGRRGNPKRLRKDIRELIIAPVREHSRKPDEAYERICQYADGPRIALFTREERPGFHCWGDEAGLFDAP